LSLLPDGRLAGIENGEAIGNVIATPSRSGKRVERFVKDLAVTGMSLAQ
jgi:hypothetical protein